MDKALNQIVNSVLEGKSLKTSKVLTYEKNGETVSINLVKRETKIHDTIDINGERYESNDWYGECYIYRIDLENGLVEFTWEPGDNDPSTASIDEFFGIGEEE